MFNALIVIKVNVKKIAGSAEGNCIFGLITHREVYPGVSDDSDLALRLVAPPLPQPYSRAVHHGRSRVPVGTHTLAPGAAGDWGHAGLGRGLCQGLLEGRPLQAPVTGHQA